MKKQSPSIETEGMQSDYIRELLDAGRDAAKNDPAIRGYDVDAGLARHAALVQAGAPLPPWAEQLVATGAGGAAGAGVGAAAGAGAGAGAAAAVAKLATGKVMAGIALAVVAAGTIAAMVIGAPEKAARVRTPEAPVVPAAPEALKPIEQAAPAPAPQAVAPEGAGEGDTVEVLDIAPITARAKRDVAGNGASQMDRAPEGDSKAAAGRGAQSTKSLDALIEAVGKDQSSKGHVSLVTPNDTVARSGSQARTERQPAASQSGQQAREPEQASAATVPAPAPVVDDARLEREMGMLAVAQRVLKSDPERALRLAQQGEKEFAGSMFTQERQQVLLLALIELGRIDEAKRLALPYLKRYPNGPFSDRVRSALAAAKSER